ncbi:MAG TPA: TonB-dependent receptor [Longimicrobiales bacterium]|nr:TonB-dependent receptor [Longimicrobiales bacterium]
MIVIALVAALVAQQPQAPDTTKYHLSPLIVTALRAQQRLIDVPLAVTSISHEQFASSSGVRIESALRLVPGIIAQSRYGGSDIRVTIRGFGARGAGDRSNAGTTRGIRFLQDGFPETEPDGRTSLDLIDLAAIERVEVVRSNASALWGNASGGLVAFSTIPEGADAHEAEVQAGAFGLQRYVARAESGDLYATLTRTKQDGWRPNSQQERNLLQAAYIGSSARVHLAAAENMFNIPGPLTFAEFQSNPKQANATYLARQERRNNRVARLGVDVDRGPVSAMIFFNPKYLQRSERGTYRDFTRYHVGGNALARFKGFTGGVDAAYQDGAILFYGLTAQGTRASDLRDNKKEGATNLGLFAQQLLRWSKLELTAGLRYDNISYNYQSFINARLNSKKSFKHLTPKIGASFKLSEDHTIYANLGGGVEAPAGNETDPASTFGQDTVFAINPLLDPITSRTVEAGTKQLVNFENGFFRSLSYDVAIYNIDVNNEIVPYRGGRFYFTAGEARRRGAETNVIVRAKTGLSLTAALTFSDNKYTDYKVDSVHYALSKQGKFADYSGNDIVGIPSRVVSLRAAQSYRGLGVELELQQTSKYFIDDANTVEVPASTLLHGGVSTNGPIWFGHYGIRASARVENITNLKHVGSAFLNPDVVNGVPVAFEPGLPRHLVLSGAVTLR